MNKIVEVCCGSYYDALQASKGGASRIELNTALHMGGLTPSLASLRQTKRHTDLCVICMIRNRGAGFCYLEEECDTMFEDAKLLLENGADGLAFGFLNADKTVDIYKTKRMVALIHKHRKVAVFHRAIDVCQDIESAFEDIIACGVDRVLSSGGCAKAVDPQAQATLTRLQTLYGERIEILPGSGINATNAVALMKESGVHQVHSSCKAYLQDSTSVHNTVDFSYGAPATYEVVDQDMVKAIVAVVEQ